jgi:hypothetical protein
LLPMLSVSLEFVPGFKQWGSFCTICTIICLNVFSSVLWCLLPFPHRNDVRFVFTPVVCWGLMS